jgi:DNA polymerase III epsilon subunit-like protein
LSDLLDWSGKDPWLAHNGNSFDFKVLQGCAERTDIPLTPEILFHDTLKLFRKYIPGHQSYSQPILYEKIFSEKYNAHVAIDDALALARLCVHCSYSVTRSTPKTVSRSTPKTASKSKTRIPNIKIRKTMDLTFGPKKLVAERKTSRKQVKTVRNISQLSGVGPKTCKTFADIKVTSLADLFQRYDEGGGPWLQNCLPFGANWKQIERSIVAAR